MRSVEMVDLIQDFAAFGKEYAEMVYEEHVRLYCLYGNPFLSLHDQDGESLLRFATYTAMLYCKTVFENKNTDTINMGLFISIYAEMFCKRYQELLFPIGEM